MPTNKEIIIKHLIFIVCLLVFAVAFDASAQQIELDAIFLLNGTAIHGTIIEHGSDEIKIRTASGSVLIYKMREIATITKVPLLSQPQLQPRRKEPVVGCLLSLFIPGTGQVYNEQYEKGIFFFLCYSVGFGCTIAAYEKNALGNWYLPQENKDLAIIGVLMLLGSSIGSMLDAMYVADEINKRNQQQSRSHLIEFSNDQFTLGVDPMKSRAQLGAMLSFRF